MTITLRPVVALAAVGLLAAGQAASAQTPGVQAAPTGLFAAGDVGRRVRQKLDFTLSLVEADDSDTPAGLSGVGAADSAIGGLSTMFVGSAEYRITRARVQFAATGSSVLRHYNELQDVRTDSHSGGIGLTTNIGPRTTFSANQTVAFSPSYLYGLFPSVAAPRPGDAVPVAPDYATNNSDSYFYGTTFGLTHGLSRRSRVSVNGDLQYTDYVHETATQGDLTSKGIRGEYSRNLARNTVLRTGYHYRIGEFGYGAVDPASTAAATTTEHGVDVGIEHTQPLSGTRRLSVGFNIGASGLTNPLGTALVANTGRLYRLSTDGSIAWQFAKGWQTRGTFRRGVEYIAQLGQPVNIDGFSADITGYLSSRLDVESAARYSSGASAVNLSTLTFDTYGADVRVRYALSRSLAVYGQYLYYFYDFQQSRQFPTDTLPGLERNGLRGGLTVWVPALRR